MVPARIAMISPGRRKRIDDSAPLEWGILPDPERWRMMSTRAAVLNSRCSRTSPLAPPGNWRGFCFRRSSVHPQLDGHFGTLAGVLFFVLAARATASFSESASLRVGINALPL
jgi:hypothetical protein